MASGRVLLWLGREETFLVFLVVLVEGFGEFVFDAHQGASRVFDLVFEYVLFFVVVGSGAFDAGPYTAGFRGL